MNLQVSLKSLGSWLLIFIPVIVMIVQQVTGIIPLRSETQDPVVFVFLMIFCISIGYGLQGQTTQQKVLFFLIAFGVLNIIPMATNVNITQWTVMGFGGIFEEISEFLGEEGSTFGIMLPYWYMGLGIGAYPYTGFQVLCLAVPISIFAISAIKISLAQRDRFNFSSGCVEIVLMVVILLISCAYGFLGLSYAA